MLVPHLLRVAYYITLSGPFNYLVIFVIRIGAFLQINQRHEEKWNSLLHHLLFGKQSPRALLYVHYNICFVVI